MNFIKLNQNGKPVLVNLDNATEIYSKEAVGGCNIYFAAVIEDDQVTISVDETLDQIYALIGQRTENNQEPDRNIEAPELQWAI